MEKNGGLLVEGENYHEVVSALEMIEKGSLLEAEGRQPTRYLPKDD